MLKQFFCIICILIFFACQKKENNQEKVARVFDSYLYLDQLPTPPNSQDSVIFTKNFINQWATKELLLNKAKFNIADGGPYYIDSLVQLYKSSLLTHSVKFFAVQTEDS